MRPSYPTTEEERIRLIGELLCKGILLSPSLRVGEGGPPAVTVIGTVDAEQRIVDYLKRHRAASPSELRAVLNLSRSGTYRALQRLLLSRQVIANGGRTSAASVLLEATTRPKSSTRR